MKRKSLNTILYVIALISFTTIASVSVPLIRGTDSLPSTVTIAERRILVDGLPYEMKGVGYAPTPIGVDPEVTPPYGDYFTSDYSSIYMRDLPLLREMGANTIRLWGWNNNANHTDF